MTREMILAEVTRILRDKIQVRSPIEWDSHLINDLELDSLNQLALVVELENHFQVSFEPGDEAGIQTVRDVVSLVARLRA